MDTILNKSFLRSTNFVKNQVTVSANDITPSQTQVTDVSDDGNDLDGNLVSDPTEVKLINNGILKVTKTVTVTQSDPTKITLGDVAAYTITVENTGNVSLTNMSFVDQITGLGGQILSLDATPAFVSNSKGTAQGGLLIGELLIHDLEDSSIYFADSHNNDSYSCNIGVILAQNHGIFINDQRFTSHDNDQKEYLNTF